MTKGSSEGAIPQGQFRTGGDSKRHGETSSAGGGGIFAPLMLPEESQRNAIRVNLFRELSMLCLRGLYC